MKNMISLLKGIKTFILGLLSCCFIFFLFFGLPILFIFSLFFIPWLAIAMLIGGIFYVCYAKENKSDSKY